MPKLGKDVNLESQLSVTNQEQTAIKTEFLLGSLGLYNIMSSSPKTSKVSQGAGVNTFPRLIVSTK